MTMRVSGNTATSPLPSLSYPTLILSTVYFYLRNVRSCVARDSTRKFQSSSRSNGNGTRKSRSRRSITTIATISQKPTEQRRMTISRGHKKQAQDTTVAISQNRVNRNQQRVVDCASIEEGNAAAYAKPPPPPPLKLEAQRATAHQQQQQHHHHHHQHHQQQHQEQLQQQQPNMPRRYAIFCQVNKNSRSTSSGADAGHPRPTHVHLRAHVAHTEHQESTRTRCSIFSQVNKKSEKLKAKSSVLMQCPPIS